MTKTFKEEAEKILNHLIMTHDHSETIAHQHNVVPVQQALSDLEQLHEAEVTDIEKRAFNAGFSLGLDGDPMEDREKLFKRFKELQPPAMAKEEK